MPSDPVPEVGEAHFGIELKRACNETPCFFQTPSTGVARRGDAQCAQVIRLLADNLFRQWPGLVMPVGVKMSDCGKVLHEGRQWIERAEPHGIRQVLDPQVRIAKPGFQQSAGAPGGCQVRIERYRAINQSGTFYKLAGNVANGEPTERERDGIV